MKMSGEESAEQCKPFGSTDGAFYRRKGVVFDAGKFNVPKKNLEDIENFNVRHDDVFIATIPRSGTHWLAEIVFLIAADADLSKVNRASMDQVFEMNLQIVPDAPVEAGYKLVEKWPSSQPRVILTHLSAEFLPPKIWHTGGAKVITLVRNPLDVFVSQHTLYSALLPKVVQDWSDFLQYNMTDDVIGGSWFHHVLSYWSRRHFKENLLFLKYEDVQRDLRGTIQAVAAFLQRPLTVDQIDRIVELTSLDGMKKTYKQMEDANPKNVYRTRMFGLKPFLDKGQVGNWKGKYNEKQLAEIKSKIKESFDGTGLSFDLEI